MWAGEETGRATANLSHSESLNDTSAITSYCRFRLQWRVFLKWVSLVAMLNCCGTHQPQLPGVHFGGAQGAFVSFATFLPSLEKLSSLVHLHPTGLSPLFVNI